MQCNAALTDGSQGLLVGVTAVGVTPPDANELYVYHKKTLTVQGTVGISGTVPVSGTVAVSGTTEVKPVNASSVNQGQVTVTSTATTIVSAGTRLGFMLVNMDATKKRSDPL